MKAPYLLHHLIADSAERAPDATALSDGARRIDYGLLQDQIMRCANGLLGLGLKRAGRVAIYLEKRVEGVIACFSAAAAGGAFVPLNPLLKPAQVEHILRDCNVQVLVTSAARLASLSAVLAACPDLRSIVLVDSSPGPAGDISHGIHAWADLVAGGPAGAAIHGTDQDMAAILYTSGSTGRPKGVVLSHRNLVAGAQSVASYLGNNRDDVLLAVLPLSFDAGFSQLTTAFHASARVVLLNYLLPRDVIRAMEREGVTGITAVPPLYIQLAQLEWPQAIADTLRYFANTGGRMPRATLAALRSRLPRTTPYLMYGLTEAFRSTYLPPEEVDRRPDSIGKAIPNAEVLVLREDGSTCVPGEAGELVHRGPLVAMGYWNDADKTAQRFRPLPSGLAAREAGLVIPELAVYSGDTVRMDDEGFLYFVGRRDEMIKTSGYRVSPTEVEEIVHGTGLVGECVAIGIDDPVLGQKIRVIATHPQDGTLDAAELLAECRTRMPAYMVPASIDVRPGPLPRNPNGKIDRAALAASSVVT